MAEFDKAVIDIPCTFCLLRALSSLFRLSLVHAMTYSMGKARHMLTKHSEFALIAIFEAGLSVAEPSKENRCLDYSHNVIVATLKCS